MGIKGACLVADCWTMDTTRGEVTLYLSRINRNLQLKTDTWLCSSVSTTLLTLARIEIPNP